MKISFLALPPRPIRLEPVEADPAAAYTRQWCIREMIRDDPSLTPAEAVALYRQAETEASAYGLAGKEPRHA